LAASAGVPLLVTTSPVLAPGVVDLLGARRGRVLTVLPPNLLDDDLLGAASRISAGLPWSPAALPTDIPLPPPPAVAGPVAASRLALDRANASPEPRRRGQAMRVRAKLRARYTDGRWRAAPAGIEFRVQFKKKGTRKYRDVALGSTTSGWATAEVVATRSGRWRIVVGGQRSGGDYVRVKR
jgi:hypothetical protein